jgi:hypothetical protein
MFLDDFVGLSCQHGPDGNHASKGLIQESFVLSGGRHLDKINVYATGKIRKIPVAAECYLMSAKSQQTCQTQERNGVPKATPAENDDIHVPGNPFFHSVFFRPAER